MAGLHRVIFNRWSFMLVVLVIGSAQRRPPAPPAPPRLPIGALPGLTGDQINSFNRGNTAFNAQETPQNGLGPVFNGRSCAECHPNGGGSTRISNVIGTAGAAQIDAGGPVIQVSANRGFRAEPIPTTMTVGRRRTMITLGLGLVGAISDSDILAEQTRQQNVLPLIAGKANIVTDAVTGDTRVGRVGQKAQHPNSTSFAAEAYLREMGITTPFFPNEEAPFNNPSLLSGNPVTRINDDGDDVLLFGIYMDLLAPPASNAPTSNNARTQVNQGATIFANIGCANCHTPTWTTASNSINALSQKQISPWSDFLLHDMGASGDQIPQGTDSNGQPIPGSWMRTTPLWGTRLNPALWHDGSVRQGDYAGAINKHAGQGLDSKTAYQSLSSSQKQALTAFLNSL